MFLPARSALQNWPSGTSLQQSLFRLILGWKPNNHATFLGAHIFWRDCKYCLPHCNQGRRGSRGSRRSGRPSSCTCGCAPASGSWASFDLRIWLQKYLLGHFLIFGFGFKNTYLGRFPKASPTLSQEEPGSGVKNHLWRTMKWNGKNFVKITLVVLWSSCSSRCSTGWCPCWSICRLDWIRIRLDSMFRCFIKRLRPGPGVREHADRKVRLAEGMCTH